MPKYKFTFVMTRRDTVIVEAEDFDEAEAQAHEMFEDGVAEEGFEDLLDVESEEIDDLS